MRYLTNLLLSFTQVKTDIQNHLPYMSVHTPPQTIFLFLVSFIKHQVPTVLVNFILPQGHQPMLASLFSWLVSFKPFTKTTLLVLWLNLHSLAFSLYNWASFMSQTLTLHSLTHIQLVQLKKKQRQPTMNFWKQEEVGCLFWKAYWFQL